jgi:hypothetical protein
MKKKVILIALLFVNLKSFAEDWLGTQPTTPHYKIDFLQQDLFIPYQPLNGTRRAPIALSIKINEEPINPSHDIFLENFYANLPDGKTIKIKNENHSNEKWMYPVGTRIVHEIRFNDSKQTIFEARMIEKVSEKIWGYGIYDPISHAYQLRTIEPAFNEYQLQTQEGLPLNIKLRKVSQATCSRCHTRAGFIQEPVGAFEETGPCEFGPINTSLKTVWAKDFHSKKGWWPFVSE